MRMIRFDVANDPSLVPVLPGEVLPLAVSGTAADEGVSSLIASAADEPAPPFASAAAPQAPRPGVTGGEGDDTLTGSGGDDTLDGGSGADSMVGGDGADTYYVDNAGDEVVETQAGVLDTIWSSFSDIVLPVNVEIYIAIAGSGDIGAVGNDDATQMLGNEGNNILASFDGDDIVLGQGGNDTIDGGAGFLDIISGGAGADLLTGGAGHDFFNYQFITDAGDVITDFHTHAGLEDDILDLRPLFPTFTNTPGVLTVDDAVASGHLSYVQSGANTQVFADADGGGDNNVLLVTLLNTTAVDVQIYTLI
jgi:Ca2+-binding RTX toxin-like protein